MTRHNKKPFPFFLWHRRLGLLALLFIFILSITGIMLNHTDSLKLDSQMIENNWLLDWYGLNPTGEPLSFTAGQHLVTQWGQQLFFEDRTIGTEREQLMGAIKSNGIIILLMTNRILLLDDKGHLIEQLKPAFAPFKQVGKHNGFVVVETSSNDLYIADRDIVSWQSISSGQINWATPTKPDTHQQEKIRQSYRGNGLTLERVILDLHSGRIFNAGWGIYIMDISAILMLVLGISGTWVWLSRKQKMKTKRHYQKHHRTS